MFKPYRLALASLCIYRNILRDPLLQSYYSYWSKGSKRLILFQPGMPIMNSCTSFSRAG